MRLCHRFGLKRVAKLLMLRDERHRSFFLFLAVLRAVVQGYVKNIETTYCGKNCRLLLRQVDAKPTFQSTHFIKCDLHQFRCNDSNAMPTTQFSSCCKREVKINMHSLCPATQLCQQGSNLYFNPHTPHGYDMKQRVSMITNRYHTDTMFL